METNKTAVTCKVVKKLAVLREHNGFTKELRIVDWNGFGPRLDLREWMPDGKCGKGITMTEDEGRKLYSALEAYFNGLSSRRAVETDDEDLPFNR